MADDHDDASESEVTKRPPCLRCGTPDASHVLTYNRYLGVFALGCEPRLCQSCADGLIHLSDGELRELFKDYATSDEALSDVLDTLQSRGDAILRRERC